MIFFQNAIFCIIAVIPQSHIEATTPVSSNRWHQAWHILILRITPTSQVLRYITSVENISKTQALFWNNYYQIINIPALLNKNVLKTA